MASPERIQVEAVAEASQFSGLAAAAVGAANSAAVSMRGPAAVEGCERVLRDVAALFGLGAAVLAAVAVRRSPGIAGGAGGRPWRPWPE